MSIIDIIEGRQPFFKPTMRQRLSTVDQDYALLASKGGGPFYLNRGCNDRFQRETGPIFDDIAAPRDSLHQDALDVLLQDRQNQSARDTNYLHYSTPQVGNAQSDVPFDLPYPCDCFWLSSINAAANTVFLHLNPLGKVYNGAGILAFITGNEEWYQLSAAQTVSGPPYFGVLSLPSKSTRIYLDVGKENGGVTTLTIGCSDKPVLLTGGVYT